MEETKPTRRVLLCPFCGYGRYALTSNQVEYCTRCGHKTIDQCPDCSSPLADPDGSFCYNCGAKVVGHESEDPTEPNHSQQTGSLHDTPTLTANCIQLVPGRRDNHHHTNTVIMISDEVKQEIQLSNAAFDYLYYLAWLKNQGLPPSTSYQKICPDIKSQLFPQYLETDRLNAKWSIGDPKSISHYIWQINFIAGRKLIVKNGPQILLSNQYVFLLEPF